MLSPIGPEAVQAHHLGKGTEYTGLCTLASVSREFLVLQSFASVEELVQNYQSEKLVLFSAGEKTGRTLLTSSPPQSFQHSM